MGPSLKALVVASLFSLTLSGCGNDYPETGKFQGDLKQLKSVSETATVYPISASDFNSWVNESEQLDQASLDSKEGIMVMREKLVEDNLLKDISEKFEYLDSAFDLDSSVQARKKELQARLEQIRSAKAYNTELISELENKKAEADKAKAKLSKIEADLEKKEQDLKSRFLELLEKSNQSVSEYIEGQRLVEKGFDYAKSKHESLTCSEDLAKQSYRYRAKVDTHIFSDRVTLNGQAYCPYFKGIGSSKSDRKKFKSTASAEQIELLKRTATANLEYTIGKKSIREKISNVKKDHPELTATANSFGYRESGQLSKEISDLASLNESARLIESKTDDELTAELVKEIANEVKVILPWYQLRSLQKNLENGGTIQPDGTFSLNAGTDFYLVEYNMAKSPSPDATRFAVIRMDQHKTQPMAALSWNDFIAFDGLKQISL